VVLQGQARNDSSELGPHLPSTVFFLVRAVPTLVVSAALARTARQASDARTSKVGEQRPGKRPGLGQRRPLVYASKLWAESPVPKFRVGGTLRKKAGLSPWFGIPKRGLGVNGRGRPGEETIPVLTGFDQEGD